ncbi:MULTISPECIES: HU family DNA-binding protein [unclassified Streptomyces]|uniref:HU family DNA-binding protein n=1 Tax=Streptomycetaceae TaxID=2062 RepID=UPI002E76B42B|nr:MULTISPECIES: HU family DNA-binding protein [unclassified Streptomyces]MED7953563.1 HU family DNA-binding protein [Streptomyces sp. BE303]MEE1826644.1 HU family DNA-binding protein [Streptomyces sp. BE20]
MNKAQLVEAVAEQLGGRKAAAEAVDAVLDTMVRAVVAGDRVSVTGFGTFEKVERSARFARNPQTGEKVKVKKTSVPRFRPGQGFKDLVSGSKKLPKEGPSVKKAPKGSLTPGKSGVAATPAAKRAATKRAATAAAAAAPAKKAAAKKTATTTAAAAKKTTATAAKKAPAAKKATTTAAAKKTTATATKKTAAAAKKTATTAAAKKTTATAAKKATATAKKTAPAKKTATRKTTARKTSAK